jgi:hypothetical protein
LDKLLHFIVSLVVSLFDPYLAAALGLGKELFDIVRGGAADAGDLLADFLGILAGAGLG